MTAIGRDQTQGAERPHRLVADLEERFRELEIPFHHAYWDSQVEATEANEERRAGLELSLRRAKGDPEAYAAVNEALAEPVHDPVLRRELEVLRLSLTGNQMDDAERTEIVRLSSAVESDFASYRPNLDGRTLTENDVDQILREVDDVVVRRKTWEASKEIGGVVAPRVRELARVRNQAARGLGFADYYRMSLELQEISEEWLFETMDALEDLTAAPYARWKAGLDERLSDRFRTNEIMPWHYADPFFQSLPPDGRISLDGLFGDASAPDLARKTFDSWGIDLSGVLAGSDLYPREQKCQHAFCLDVDRTGRDVRILANVVPGERWIEVMLHESGHAAYDVSIGGGIPWLLHRAAHTFVTEAIAIFSGRLSRDPRWLVEVAGVAADQIAPLEAGLVTADSAQSLVFARWGLVMTHFEREMYADPETDLDSIWWDLVERFQLVPRPPDRSRPDWAAKIHVAVAPVYYHNYLLGEILASQLHASIRRECGHVGGPETGAFLTDRVFRVGSLLRWDSVVEEATGRGLAADDFAVRVASG